MKSFTLRSDTFTLNFNLLFQVQDEQLWHVGRMRMQIWSREYIGLHCRETRLPCGECVAQLRHVYGGVSRSSVRDVRLPEIACW